MDRCLFTSVNFGNNSYLFILIYNEKFDFSRWYDAEKIFSPRLRARYTRESARTDGTS